MVRHQLSPVWSSERDPFADLLRPFLAQYASPTARAVAAPADVFEHDDSYFVSLEIPGVDPEKIELHIEGDTLTIKGEKLPPGHPESAVRHLSERGYGKFTRSFTFPMAVAADHVEAKARDGVLGVKVRKRPELQPRRIEVQRG